MSRAQKFFLSLLVVTVVESSISTSALAYATGGARWPADVPCTGAACLGQPVTIRYSYVNMFDGGIKMPDGNPLPNSLIKGSIEEALHVWTTAAPLNFVEVPDDGFVHLGQVRFRHMYINGPDPPPPALPIAKANVPFIGYGTGTEVRFDDGDRWQEAGTQPNPDVLGAATHEIGHILGLDHTQVEDANMYWIFHRFQGLTTGQLFPDDIAGIQYLYGSGAGSVTPLGVPEPATCLVAAALLSAWPFARRNRNRRTGNASIT